MKSIFIMRAIKHRVEFNWAKEVEWWDILDVKLTRSFSKVSFDAVAAEWLFLWHTAIDFFSTKELIKGQKEDVPMG